MIAEVDVRAAAAAAALETPELQAHLEACTLCEPGNACDAAGAMLTAAGDAAVLSAEITASNARESEFFRARELEPNEALDEQLERAEAAALDPDGELAEAAQAQGGWRCPVEGCGARESDGAIEGCENDDDSDDPCETCANGHGCVCAERREEAAAEEADPICGDCSGSGEGRADGTTCRTCHGAGDGPRPSRSDDDEPHEAES